MEYKVLVADDERAIDRQRYQLRTEARGVQCRNGGQWGRRAEKSGSVCPHILVLDIMMPKMSGLDVCRKLASQNHLGILLLTAKNDIVD